MRTTRSLMALGPALPRTPRRKPGSGPWGRGAAGAPGPSPSAQEVVERLVEAVRFRSDLFVAERALFDILAAVAAAVFIGFAIEEIAAHSTSAAPFLFGGVGVFALLRLLCMQRSWTGREAAAAFIDRTWDLKQRLLTMVEFSSPGAKPRLYAKLVSDVVSAIGGRDVRRLRRHRFPRSAYPATAFLLALLLHLLLGVRLFEKVRSLAAGERETVIEERGTDLAAADPKSGDKDKEVAAGRGRSPYGRSNTSAGPAGGPSYPKHSGVSGPSGGPGGGSGGGMRGSRQVPGGIRSGAGAGAPPGGKPGASSAGGTAARPGVLQTAGARAGQGGMGTGGAGQGGGRSAGSGGGAGAPGRGGSGSSSSGGSAAQSVQAMTSSGGGSPQPTQAVRRPNAPGGGSPQPMQAVPQPGPPGATAGGSPPKNGGGSPPSPGGSPPSPGGSPPPSPGGSPPENGGGSPPGTGEMDLSPSVRPPKADLPRGGGSGAGRTPDPSREGAPVPVPAGVGKKIRLSLSGEGGEKGRSVRRLLLSRVMEEGDPRTRRPASREAAAPDDPDARLSRTQASEDAIPTCVVPPEYRDIMKRLHSGKRE